MFDQIFGNLVWWRQTTARELLLCFVHLQTSVCSWFIIPGIEREICRLCWRTDQRLWKIRRMFCFLHLDFFLLHRSLCLFNCRLMTCLMAWPAQHVISWGKQATLGSEFPFFLYLILFFLISCGSDVFGHLQTPAPFVLGSLNVLCQVLIFYF